MECLDLSQPTMGCQDVKQEGNGPLEERATMTLNLTSELNSVSTITVINILPFIFIFMASEAKVASKWPQNSYSLKCVFQATHPNQKSLNCYLLGDCYSMKKLS